MSVLTVLTQNAWGGFPRWNERAELLADRIHALRAEVVGLQEIHASSSGEGAATQAHALAARGDYHVHYAQGRAYGDASSEGVALLVRPDARAHAPRALTLDPSDRFEGTNQRTVLAVTLEHPEGPVDVFVTHLSLSRTARARTARELLDFVHEVRRASGSVAAVLMGDLNATDDEPAVETLESEWCDAWRLAHPGRRGGTWPALVPFRRIDYVFVQPRDRVHVESCRRIPYSGSDHLGVLARLRLV